jgi:nitrite reductase/ring-hydroxylating ferredoxin subunit/uncharacterized membrane protein
MTMPGKLVERIEKTEALDRAAGPLVKLVGRLVQPRPVRNALSGTDLGHPLHPMLTDLPIGAWTMSALLDLVGGRGSRRAADMLVAAGLVCALPTVATGLNDWSDTYGPETRLGLAHAGANGCAFLLYATSSISRLRGRRDRARLVGLAGLAVLTVGGYLGGHLSYALGVNVNRTAYEHRPSEWTPVIDEAAVAEGSPVLVTAGDVPVLLYREADRIYALSDTCSHMGGPLHEGSIADGRVTCPWHGSAFRLTDGRVHRGPASNPQPTFRTRVVDGRVEVRAD